MIHYVKSVTLRPVFPVTEIISAVISYSIFLNPGFEQFPKLSADLFYDTGGDVHPDSFVSDDQSGEVIREARYMDTFRNEVVR